MFAEVEAALETLETPINQGDLFEITLVHVDALTTLRAEIKRLDSALTYYIERNQEHYDRAEAAEARVAELEAALPQ